MNKYILLISLLLAFPVSVTYAQTGSITGIVTDSLTGQPVPNFTVFIPSSTFGTTTNQKGEYLLDGLNPGDYTLMFRHLSYPALSRMIRIESGKQVSLNLIVAEQSKTLEEVVIVGRIPDRQLGFSLFQQYFLGDTRGSSCYVENPKDLKFYYEGLTLKATSTKPLKIINRYLGYRITYYLDYFKYAENRNPETHFDEGGYFGYAGSAFYEDLTQAMPLKAIGFKLNRTGVFKGSPRHFLSSLFLNDQAGNRYHIRRVYYGPKDLQQSEKQSNAMTKIKLAMMDSLFSWDPVSGKSEFLYYYPDEDYVLNPDLPMDGLKAGEKAVCSEAALLVFYDFAKSPDLRDDWISMVKLPAGGIIFDRDGNYRASGGKLNWTNLDNSLQIKVSLPDEFIPKMK